MRRRQFLETTALATVAAGLARPLLALPPDHPYMHQIGLQLYTVRNELANDRDGTLKAIADIGYKQVELMSTVDGQDIAKAAKDHGMNVTSGFFNWKTIVDPAADDAPRIGDVIEAAQNIGLKYLVFGYIGKGHRETSDQLRKIADSANAAGEKIKQAGMQMCYHNHAFEFEPLENDNMGFDIFVERFDHDLVPFEVDVFWAAIGGWDPAEILRRLDGRVAQLHLKDIKPGTGTIFDETMVPNTAFQEVGDGSVDFGKILTVAEEIGVEQCHVEQDQSPAPLQSIGESFNYLEALNL